MALCTSQLKDMFLIPTPTSLCWTYPSCSFNGWWTNRRWFHSANKTLHIRHRNMSLYRQWITIFNFLFKLWLYILYVLISFNAIMIVNILLQILFGHCPSVVKFITAVRLMDPLILISTTNFYFILDEPIPEILLMIIYTHMFNISCIHSFVFPSW